MTPYSIEAEQSLLGALLVYGADAASRIECNLEPKHFYREDHGVIYSAIRKLLDAGKPIDVLTVSDDLENAGTLARIGGLAHLGELASVCASFAGTRRHAEIIVEKASIRSLLALSSQIQELVLEPGVTTQDKISEAQKLVMGLSDRQSVGADGPKSVAELFAGYCDAMNSRVDGAGVGMATGFPDLDKRLGSGIEGGWLVILTGRPGSGKTAIALQIAHHFAHEGRTALVCSQEMQSNQLLDRIVSFVGRVPLQGLRAMTMTGDEMERLNFAMSSIQNIPLHIDEQGSLKLEDVRRKARKVKAKHGLSLVVVDYLQLMEGNGDNRTQELTQITKGLKALAKELNCGIIALSQLNRAVEQRPNKRPLMSDLRESGSIEQDADVIAALYRDEYYNEQSQYKGLAELLILKNRQGESGGFVPLVFNGAQTRFDSLFGGWPSENSDRPKKRGFG